MRFKSLPLPALYYDLINEGKVRVLTIKADYQRVDNLMYSGYVALTFPEKPPIMIEVVGVKSILLRERENGWWPYFRASSFYPAPERFVNEWLSLSGTDCIYHIIERLKETEGAVRGRHTLIYFRVVSADTVAEILRDMEKEREKKEAMERIRRRVKE